MRIFLTGPTGFVGTAVLRELIDAGHQVTGLARSEAAARSVAEAGATPHRGDLAQPESLRRGASEADAVVHTGFVHDFANFKACCELDRGVIATLGAALAGSPRPLIVTSGVALLPPGALATEQARPLFPSPNPRAATEEAARALVEQGLNVAIVRLPPSVHGEGDHGFVPLLIKMARDKGVSAYIGEGRNHWPAVHRSDAAKVYRLALERAAPCACYHAVAEQGVAFREIAEVIGRRLGRPVVSQTKEEAAAHFSWFAHFAAMDVMASSEQTQEQLNWSPSQVDLIADLDAPHYFA